MAQQKRTEKKTPLQKLIGVLQTSHRDHMRRLEDIYSCIMEAADPAQRISLAQTALGLVHLPPSGKVDFRRYSLPAAAYGTAGYYLATILSKEKSPLSCDYFHNGLPAYAVAKILVDNLATLASSEGGKAAAILWLGNILEDKNHAPYGDPVTVEDLGGGPLPLPEVANILAQEAPHAFAKVSSLIDGQLPEIAMAAAFIANVNASPRVREALIVYMASVMESLGEECAKHDLAAGHPVIDVILTPTEVLAGITPDAARGTKRS